MGSAAQPVGVASWLAALPYWLVVGLLASVAFAVFASVAFLVGTRLLPAPETGRGGHDPVDDRRRAEIRGYLRGLDESFAEDHPVAGQSVAFYLPERRVAITFDPRAYFRIERSGTHAVLVEHELPGAALGARLPFETPTPGDHGSDGGLADADATDPEAAAFEVLGLPAGADLAAVKAAYRERAKTVHPDQGGDPEEFQRVREAYTVAREAAR